MATDAKVQIGTGPDYLEGVNVTTPAGANLFREGVVLSDPDVAAARAAVVNAQPGASVYGPATWIQGTVTVTGPLTDAQLRATPVPVSGPLTDAQLRALAVPVSIAAVVSNNLTQYGGVAVGAANAVHVQPGTGASFLTTNANLDVLLSTRLKPADTLAGVTTVATVSAVTAITNALPTGANIIGSVNGDVDHDAPNTLKQIQIGGHASPADIPPTAVSANGDRARIWVERSGAIIVRRRKIRETYTAVFRLAEAAARLDQTFTQVANTNKQWATIYHAASATKEVDLLRLVCYITAWSAASQAVLELRELTGATAPATGNPAITPKPRRVGGTAAETTCLYLPTTQGSETAVNSPLASIIIDEGIMGAASTANPFPQNKIVLYDGAAEDDEALCPTLPVATAGGWAVMLRTVGIPAVRMTVEAVFTEEIP